MIVAGIVAGLSGVGLIQALAGLVLVNRFDSLATRTAGAAEPPVTVLKPLHGGEPLLEEALASVCRQVYPSWQVVFGVNDPADLALPVVRRLQARFPACDIAVVVDPTPHGPNRKVANLINMLPAAKHDVLVIADSDVHVAADWLSRLAAALAAPGTGLATTVYTGLPCGAVGHLGALQINHYFLPGALLARAMGRQDCLGASMMLRRETLERIGGLHALVNHLADDNVLGRLVRRLGSTVALADTIPATTVGRPVSRRCGATSCAGPAPFARWSPCRSPPRCCNTRWPGRRWRFRWPARRPGRWPGSPPPGQSARCAARSADRALALANRTPLWLLPVRELMSVAVMAASFVGRRVEWRGHTMHAEGIRPAMMKTLFLHPPSFDGFDGGAGSRYQARREIRSFWYPTWLAQPAALVPGSKLIDAPPARIGLDAVTAQARDFELCVIHTSTPSFASDVKVAAALKQANPALKIGFVGAKVAVQPEESLRQGAPIDFVARNEFDFTVKEIAEGRDWPAVDGISYRDGAGGIVHNQDRAILEDMDQLPFVTEVYKRDLRIEDYFIGYLLHPYVSLYTGRGCKSRCTFCLWPQTVGGHRYRVRSPEHVAEEIALAQRYLPAGAGILLRRRHLHRQPAARRGDRARARQAGRDLVVQRQGQRAARHAEGAEGQRAAPAAGRLRERQPADPAQHQEGHAHRGGGALHPRLPRAGDQDPRHLHPRPARRDAADDRGDHPLRHARSTRTPSRCRWPRRIPARSSTTRRWRTAGWMRTHAELVDEHGIQIAPLSYPHLSHTEIFDNVETFYKRFYFRAPKIASIVGEMVRSPQMMKRRLREGVEFFQFLRERHRAA